MEFWDYLERAGSLLLHVPERICGSICPARETQVYFVIECVLVRESKRRVRVRGDP